MTVEEKLEECSLIILLGNCDPNNDAFSNDDFITKVLRKKIEVFNIPIELPIWLGNLISCCTNCNPGYSQIILDELLEYINKNNFNNQGIESGYQISVIDFTKAFNQIPIIDIPEIGERIKKKYDEIKHTVPNFDTVEFWMKHFK